MITFKIKLDFYFSKLLSTHIDFKNLKILKKLVLSLDYLTYKFFRASIYGYLGLAIGHEFVHALTQVVKYKNGKNFFLIFYVFLFK